MGVSLFPARVRQARLLFGIPTSVLPTFWPLTNSAALMVVVSVVARTAGTDFGGWFRAIERGAVAGLMPGVILTVTESTKSPGLG